LTISLEAGSDDKTLSRVDDPVVVQGKILAAISGARLDRLSLMVCTGDGFKPVPFQVDEKDPAGDYVYTGGPMAGKDDDPGLDQNDELVFLAESIGARCDDRPWPEGARSGALIEIIDPIDKGRGWLYLFEFEGSPPRSPLDLVSREFTSERSTTTARGYMWGSKAGQGFPDELHLPDADGKMGPDLLDRWKSRGVIDLPLIKFEMKSDEIIRHQAVGWIDGPVRVIVRDRASMKISFIEYDLPTKVMLYYYPNSCVFPMSVNVNNPEMMELVTRVADINSMGGLDYNEHGYGIHHYDSINPYDPQVVFDGRMSDAERRLNTTEDLDWIVGYRPGSGGVLVRFYMPEEFSGIVKGLYYLEDDSKPEPPEDHPGTIAHGFQYKMNLENVKEGHYTAYTQFFFKPDLVPGREKTLLDIFDHPLEVKSTPLDKTP
jgi:hypothetical protein